MIEGALDGRVALVTGASRGIGRAAAETLAWAGARVVMVARSGEALADLAVRVGGHPVPADVSSPAEVEALVARVTDAAGAPPRDSGSRGGRILPRLAPRHRTGGIRAAPAR